MSADTKDNQSYALIIGEGVHDVAAVGKILKLWGFREKTNKQNLPLFLQKMIPTKYPYKDILTHIVPHPSFFGRRDGYIVVSNAGGKDNLGAELYERLGNEDPDAFLQLRCVAVLADMDDKDTSIRGREVQEQLEREFGPQLDRIKVQSFLQGSISIQNSFSNDWRSVPAFLYLFPDGVHEGTLERVLLAGAEYSYSDLRSAAEAYIQQTDRKKYPLPNFDEEKAAVGVIANILKPGKANQVSIHDNDWFTDDTLRSIPMHIQFAEFLRKVVETLSL